MPIVCDKHSVGFRVGSFPHPEQAANETLALPIYADLTVEQQSYVVKSIQKFYSRK